MNIIEVIKQIEYSVDYEEVFYEVITWNEVAGKSFNLNQKFLVEEELSEVLSSKNVLEFASELCDVFVVSSQEYYNKFKEPPDYRIQVDSISYGLDMIQDSINKDQHWRVYLIVTEILNKCKFDVKGALNEIVESNWTKIPRYSEFGSDEDYCLAECRRIEGDGRYTDVQYELVKVGEEVRVVFKDSNQKILKPFCFVPADLSKFV